jgi:DNA replication ATP-dependent helicase Dna2
MDFSQLADGFHKALFKILQLQDQKMKFGELYRSFNSLFFALTQQEKVQFATQFARISFATHKYNLLSQTEWKIHEFRKLGRKVLFENEPIEESLVQLGVSALCEVLTHISEVQTPDFLYPFLPKTTLQPPSSLNVAANIDKVRAIVLSIDDKECIMNCKADEISMGTIAVRFDEATINEQFSSSVNLLKNVWQNYTTINLLDVSIDENGLYHPKIIVIEPDYLVDVSAIAGCFNSPTESILYLVRKFLPFETTPSLIVGNIANFFLDELMNDPEISFLQVFPKVFKTNPLQFSLLDDKQVRDIMSESQRHFISLKQMVKVGFEENDINPADCYLEPSFYSEDYGLQGRLDIWYQNPQSAQNSAIVELKSGTSFNPNQYGISDSHYVQALLYDLLVKSVYHQKEPRNYILYSKNQIDNLRFAPIIKAKQNEALVVRNQIVTIEELLVQLHAKTDKTATILDRVRPENYPNIKGFAAKDIDYFSKTIATLSPLERAYFLAFTSFTAREHQLSKMGMQGNDRMNGLASLWLNPFEEKNEAFEILSHLKVIDNRASHNNPILIFEKHPQLTNDLANFRVGDIAILYPSNYPENGETVLDSQIFKCSIIDINPYFIAVKLRFKQFNTSIFDTKEQFWVLEHDQMDYGFNSMYRGLFAFVQNTAQKKDLLFTTQPPRKPITTVPNFQKLQGIKTMTEEQQLILQKALNAPDYFLLWGPPGTGKTSVMLKTLVEYLLHFTDENILLLAYTNRAVDEICEAIENVGEKAKHNYIRIGTQYATQEHFHHALLDKKLEKVQRREELKQTLHQHRIFVATVAAIHNRQDLLLLKSFNRVIIDEASQILEPMLIGLLPQFKQFILIGDHKQLPAVVQQDKPFSVTDDPLLQNIGLVDMRNSLFERLFLRCQTQNWHWAYDMLSYQGRMHREIMQFPNQFFYENGLKILPDYCGINQSDAINYVTLNQNEPLKQRLLQKRMLFFGTDIDNLSNNSKTNKFEAEQIAAITDAFCQLFQQNNIPIQYDKTIGIITPYRAQIAQIKQALERYEKNYENFTIDTVERYQGGARDVILISVCLNNMQQLDTLVSLDSTGTVDRKLNVALTRAKKHLVIVGNEKLMRHNPIYNALINFISS